MSPSEFDLRAALRDGEGDAPDPESILAAGRARASARRSRVAAVSATVVGVLAIGTTGAILFSHNGTDRSTADSAASRAAAPQVAAGPAGSAGPKDSAQQPANSSGLAPAAGTGSHPSAANSTSASAASGSSGGGATACPSSYAPDLPSGGNAGQSDPQAALFPKPVTSVVVCGYGSTSFGADVSPGHLVLTGSDAARLVSSLETAPTTRANRVCPDFRVADDHRLAFVGVTADDSGQAPVYTTLGQNQCISRVTNGTAVRYSWSPPTDLQAKLFALSPR